MNFSLRRELPVILIVLIPFAYLAFIWDSLPEKVPLHWNIHGEIDRWGGKSELWILPFLLPFLIYVLFTVIPIIDPRKRIAEMGGKFYQLKLIIVGCMALVATVIIYAVQEQELSESLLLASLGLLFAVLGNYFKTVRPNYFIGMRTPWALENETVWRKTHQLGGKVWFAGGLLIILTSLTLEPSVSMIIFLSVVALLILVPLVYSYKLFQRLK